MAENVLPDFEGKEVIEARAKVTNAGDGLSQAMHFDPFIVHQGEKRYLVLEVECADVQHPFADKKSPEKGLARVHILKASTGLFLDSKVIGKAVDEQAKINAKNRALEEQAKREARGEFPIPGIDDED